MKKSAECDIMLDSWLTIQTDFFSENSLFGLFISDYVQNFENSMSEMKEFL